MPAADTATARDEMLARLTAALAASTDYTDIKVIYEDAMDDQPTQAGSAVPDGQPWLVVGVRHADGTQSSLGDISGKRRQEQSGVIFVQMFTPSGDGLKTADPLGDVILDAWRTGGATPSGVQFKSARRVEIGKSGASRLTNLFVDFQYDLIR